MPFLHRQLTDHCDRAPPVARIHQFHQVAAVGRGERLQSPVVNDDQCHLSEALDELKIRTGGSSLVELRQQLRQAQVAHVVIEQAYGAAEPAHKIRLPGPARSGDQQVLGFLDPAALVQLRDLLAIEVARGTIINLIEARGHAEIGAAPDLDG